MKLRIKLTTMIAVLAVTMTALADGVTPISHPCSKPSKPYKFKSQWEVDHYNSEIQIYKTCLTDFAEAERKAAEAHQKASNYAIDEWNHFIQYELN